MQPTTVCKVAKTVSCHCWNADRTQIAIATRNSNDIFIYENCCSSRFEDWKLLHTLSGHDLPITGLDWDPIHNRILSCSEDCNAYVWNYENGKWLPTLVVLKIQRAALCCKWSPDGNAFAVGSSNRKLRICTFNADQNLWVSPLGVRVKQERDEDGEAADSSTSSKTRGSIFCVCWDRTGQLLCRGSLDGSMSVVSTYYNPSLPIRDCPFDIASKDLFGFVFGDTCGVVESIAFSPNNTTIAYSDRNSDVHFLDFTIHCASLPFTHIAFLSNTVLLAGGFDGNLYVLNKQNGKWEYRGTVDVSAGTSSGLSSSFQERIRMLQSSTNKGGVKTTGNRDSAKGSVGPHKNAITGIQVMEENKQVSTCGLDGRIVIWNMEAILKRMGL
ncbi:hypothetical protein BLSTO_03672 [Blastocystis sp. subtype 1]